MRRIRDVGLGLAPVASLGFATSVSGMRARGPHLALILLVCVATPVCAAFDLGGTWIVNGLKPDASPARITQSGADLTLTLAGYDVPYFSGYIDTLTGEFVLTLDERSQGGQTRYCNAALHGTLAVDGQTFTGIESWGQRCIPPPFSCGQCEAGPNSTVTGVRTT